MDTKIVISDTFDSLSDLTLVSDLFEMANDYEFSKMLEKLADEINS